MALRSSASQISLPRPHAVSDQAPAYAWLRFNRTTDFESVREIKESLCYVSYDLDMDTHLAEETIALVKATHCPMADQSGFQGL